MGSFWQEDLDFSINKIKLKVFIKCEITKTILIPFGD